METEVSTMEAIQARDAEFRAYLVTLGQSLASGEITEPWLPDVWDMENEENYGQDEEPEDDKDDEKK